MVPEQLLEIKLMDGIYKQKEGVQGGETAAKMHPDATACLL